jgi:type I restriction enzyme R subunit
MHYNESDTRAKLIDPALHARGWTEDLIKREETAGAIEIVGDRARRRGKGVLITHCALRLVTIRSPSPWH